MLTKLLTVATLLAFLTLGACTTPNATPAIEAATLTREVYLHAMDGNEALVRRSNPSEASLNAYLTEAAKNRRAYDEAHTKLIAAIGSISSMDPNAINSTTAAIVDLIRASNGLPPLTPPAPTGGVR